MPSYCVNDRVQSNGDHEVHVIGCRYTPSVGNRTALGFFSSCRSAVDAARKIYPRSNGCYTCSRECHTS